jgi:hypothetical protein
MTRPMESEWEECKNTINREQDGFDLLSRRLSSMGRSASFVDPRPWGKLRIVANVSQPRPFAASPAKAGIHRSAAGRDIIGKALV